MHEQLNQYMLQGAHFLAPEMLGRLAELYAAAGNLDAALPAVQQALQLVESGCEPYAAPYLYRLLGDLQLAGNGSDPAEAERSIRASIEISKTQGARSETLLSVVALGRLLSAAARHHDAYDVLAPAHEGFSPTPEFPAIAEAQALLAELAAEETVAVDLARRQQLSRIRSDHRRAVAWSEGHWSSRAASELEGEKKITPVTEDGAAHYAEVFILVARY